MEQKTFALKGNIIYTKERTRFEVMEQGWLVCEEGRVGIRARTNKIGRAHV